MKFNEDKIISEVMQYIKSTYGQHYVGKDEDGIQTVEFWMSLGSGMTTCRDTAIKYLTRYGKKDGYNKKDLHKAIHFIILMLSFAEKESAKGQTIVNRQSGPPDRVLLQEDNGKHF